MTSTATTTQINILTPSTSPKKPSFFPPSKIHFFPSIKTTPFTLKRTTPPSLIPAAAAKKNPTGEQKFTHEGSITESLPNGMFRVKLDNEDLIIGYISGKIRQNFVRILPGDRVRVEVSRYDSSRGRIVYRIRNRDSSAGN